MAAYCPKHGKDGLFKELGSEENGVTEVESVCMYCHENTYQDQDRMTLSSKMEETKPKIIACGTISRRTRSTFDAESEENTVEREDEEEDDPDEDCLWPSHKEDKLIQMYEERPFLYDITAEGYSNRRKKTMAHNDMSEKLGVTVKDVISRLKTLRNAFTRQTREVASGSGKKKLTERNRYIVKKLGFLKCHIRQRPSVSTYHLTKDPYEEFNMEHPIKVEEMEEPETSMEPDEPCIDVGDTSHLTKSYHDTYLYSPSPPPSQPVSPQASLYRLQTNKRWGEDSEGLNDTSSTKRQKIQNEEFVPSPKGKGRGKKIVINSMAEAFRERTDMMRNVAATLVGAPLAAPPPAQFPAEYNQQRDLDPDHLWTQLLCTKLKRMPADQKDEFQLRVDRLALEVCKGKWDPNKADSGNDC